MLLLFLSLFSATSAVHLGDLKWQPDLITKQSILADHLKLSEEPLYPGMNTLAFVAPWNPRGFLLARKRAARLSFVSPAWLGIQPHFEQNNFIGMKITNQDQVNDDFLRSMRKANPDIKVVPLIQFPMLTDKVMDALLTKEVIVDRVGRTIANYCRKRGFDGVVLDLYSSFSMKIFRQETRAFALEAIHHLGNLIRKQGLTAILSLLPPLIGVDGSDGKYELAYGMSSEQFRSVVDAYDYVQIWTYSNIAKGDRRDFAHEWLLANIEFCGGSPKIMLGFNFYGSEYDLAKFSENDASVSKKGEINSKRFLEVLKQDDSKLEFNRETLEHRLIFERNNSLIIFPSLTTLEYRIALAKEKNVAISLWDYGQGLDYFTNLV